MKFHSAADARPNQLQQKSPTGSLPPAVPLAITPTFRPWTHTSDDSYMYLLSLVVATATVSYLCPLTYARPRATNQSWGLICTEVSTQPGYAPPRLTICTAFNASHKQSFQGLRKSSETSRICPLHSRTMDSHTYVRSKATN